MRTIDIVPTFEGWQAAARALLREGVAPGEVGWREASPGEASTDRAHEAPTPGATRVPRQFLDLARQAAGAADPARWHVLYDVLWRLVRENRDLLKGDLWLICDGPEHSSGRQTVTFGARGIQIVTSVAGRRIGYFEDVVTTTATAEELAEAKERKSAYQKAVPLPPGRYRVDILVRDVESGAASIQHVGFAVPKFGTDLASSSLVLASLLEQVSDVSSSRQFLIGDKKVIPNLSGTYHRGAPVGIYMQIYNAGIDQTTLRPSVDVEYALIKDGKEILKTPEDWRGNSAAGQRLTLARLLDSRRLNPGDYSIEVRVRDRVSGQLLVQTAKFAIVP